MGRITGRGCMGLLPSGFCLHLGGLITLRGGGAGGEGEAGRGRPKKSDGGARRIF